MKKKMIVLLAVLLGCSAPMLAPKAEAIDFSISIGDRPYYYGPHYWHEGYRWVWVPGHRYRGRWIRGHYERRGGYNRRYIRHRYRHHRYDRYDRHESPRERIRDRINDRF